MITLGDHFCDFPAFIALKIYVYSLACLPAAVGENVGHPLTCVPNEDSDQPAHTGSLIRIFVDRMKKHSILGYQKAPGEDSQIKLILITKTRLYNFEPLKPHFYIVKLGFTGVYTIFFISARKHRLWVLVRTA